MSRETVTLNYTKAGNAEETKEIPLVLLTIDDPNWVIPIRVCNNTKNVDSRGQTFIGYPFEITLPKDSTEGVTASQLKIDNVRREQIAAIRGIQSPPSMLMEVVAISTPDEVEAEWKSFKLSRVNYNAFTITGDIVPKNSDDEAYPKDSYVPATHPGLF